MSCAAFIVNTCVYRMLSPRFFINVFYYLVLPCIHVCVDYVIEKLYIYIYILEKNVKLSECKIKPADLAAV